MKFKVISCKMFQHEIEIAATTSPHKLEIEYIDLGEHAHPNELQAKLQSKIDQATAFDAVLLCYGLCGRATDGLSARNIPIILPRSHDCGGILLGSRKRFEDVFREMPSTPFSSVGIVENGDYFFDGGTLILGDGWEALVEQYGEEDAQYIYDMMHPKLDGKLQPIYFIGAPEIDSAKAKKTCQEKAEAEGREFRELAGDLRLIRMLLAGEHTPSEFLIVNPGESIRQTGDWDQIVKATLTTLRSIT